MDKLEHLRHTAFKKELYKQREEIIERVFADANQKHGIHWTKYRGLQKVTVHNMLTFDAINFKKLATWLWKGSRPLFFILKILNSKDKKSWTLNPTLFIFSLKRLVIAVFYCMLL